MPNIWHLAESDGIEMSTFNKIYSGVKNKCFKMPNALYS